MSYRSPPPPPPNKSSYGDTELSDDGWAQHSGPPKFTNYPQGNMGGQAIQPAFNQGVGSRYAPGNVQQNQMQPVSSVDAASLAKSMTPEDILFMRKFRTDCLVYRVLPIAATCCGTLYWYNKSKQLPNKVGRFLLIGLGSLFVGVTSSRGDFVQRVKESRLETPYMQALRRTVGLQPLGTDFVGDQSVEFGSMSADGSTNWGATELSGDLRYGDRTDNRPPGQFNPDSSYQSFDSNSLDTPKPAATYEELRARNRGYGR